MTASNDFPIRSIGIVYGISGEFEVHWTNPDLVTLTEDGDEVSTFCSTSTGGFTDQHDVMDQARNVVADWDAEGF